MNDQNAPDAGSVAPKRGLKTILRYIALALVALVAVLCVVIAMRPDDFKVSRSATMKASPTAVFEQVNDFHKWDAWSPWAKMDPNAKSTFAGPNSGKDAKFSWAGNSDVGEGSMTIVESEPNDHVRIKLDFVKPFAGTNDVLMKIEPKDGETLLTWSMAGKTNFMTKAVGLFMDCEKMVGDQFDQGLASMKTIVESEPKH
jgi:hypothetical protein